MKKQFSAILVVVLSSLCLSAPLSANAEVVFNRSTEQVDSEEGTIIRDSFEIDCDSFTYSLKKNDGVPTAINFTSKTDVQANFMVTGRYSVEGENGLTECYTLAELGFSWSGAEPVFWTKEYASESLNGQELSIGDVLYIVAEQDSYGLGIVGHDRWDVCEYLGNGVDVYGEDFRKVLHNELIENSPFESEKFKRYYGDKNVNTSSFSVSRGDATEDDTISIVDVLAVNQSLLGVRTLSNYGVLASDVNHNGTVEDEDAMKILKSLVGLETLE